MQDWSFNDVCVVVHCLYLFCIHLQINFSLVINFRRFDLSQFHMVSQPILGQDSTVHACQENAAHLWPRHPVCWSGSQPVIIQFLLVINFIYFHLSVSTLKTNFIFNIFSLPNDRKCEIYTVNIHCNLNIFSFTKLSKFPIVGIAFLKYLVPNELCLIYSWRNLKKNNHFHFLKTTISQEGVWNLNSIRFHLPFYKLAQGGVAEKPGLFLCHFPENFL